MNKTDIAASRQRDPARAKPVSHPAEQAKGKQGLAREGAPGEGAQLTKNRRAVTKAAEQAAPSKAVPAVSTIRFTKRLADGLRLLKATSGKNVNVLVSEAVSEFLVRRLPEVESDINSMLDMMKAYRLENPEFEADLQAFVADESASAGQDPLEGRIVRVNARAAASRKSTKTSGKARSEAVDAANRVVFGS